MKKEVSRHELSKEREIIFYDDGSVLLSSLLIDNYQFTLDKEEVNNLEDILRQLND